MKSTWIRIRKPLLLRDLVRDYITACIQSQKNTDTLCGVPECVYALLLEWTGTELAPGQLWQIKEHSHLLFRRPHPHASIDEHLFDWSISAVYNSAMSLLEFCHQLSVYKPLLEQSVATAERSRATAQINRCFAHIENVERQRDTCHAAIREQLRTAGIHLQALCRCYADTSPLLCYLLDKQSEIDLVWGPGSAVALLKSMYDDDLAAAYVAAAVSCRQHGWQARSVAYAQHALDLDPQQPHARAIIAAVS